MSSKAKKILITTETVETFMIRFGDSAGEHNLSVPVDPPGDRGETNEAFLRRLEACLSTGSGYEQKDIEL